MKTFIRLECEILYLCLHTASDHMWSVAVVICFTGHYIVTPNTVIDIIV